MRTQTVAVVGTLALLMLSPAISAQEAALTSYDDLLARIQQLEAQQQQTRGHDTGFDQGCGSCDGSGGCCDCCPSGCCGGGWFAFYENVLVKPHFTSDPAFYIANDSAAAGGVFHREVSFDWDLEYSPRFEIGYLNDCACLGWRARYWYFDANTSQSATAPAGQEIYAGFGGDGVSIELDGVAAATASRTLELHVIDIELMFRDCNWTYSGGLRYVNMEQTYSARELGVANPDSFFSGHDLEVYGPTVAVEVYRPCTSCLTFFGKARGSFLYGESGFSAVNTANPLLGQIFLNNDHDLLGIAELQLGVLWERCLSSGGRFFVTAAVEAQYWASAGTGSPLLSDPNDDTNYHDEGPQSADMGFIGFSIGAGLRY